MKNIKRILCAAGCLLMAATLPACAEAVPNETSLTAEQQAELDRMHQRVADKVSGLTAELPAPAPTGDAVCDKLNTERAGWGCTPLMLNDTLMHAAAVRLSEVEAAEQGSGAQGLHVRTDGTKWSTVLSEFNLSKTHTGETVLIGSADADTFLSAMQLNTVQTEYLLVEDYRQLGYAHNDTYDIWVLLLTE